MNNIGFLHTRIGTLRATYVVAFLGVFLVGWPTLASAESADLPSAPAVRDALSRLDIDPGQLAAWFEDGTASAASCAFEGNQIQCTCLRAPGMQAASWARSANGTIRAENVLLDRPISLWLGQVQLQGDDAEIGLLVVQQPTAIAARNGAIGAKTLSLNEVTGGQAEPVESVCDEGVPRPLEGTKIQVLWTAANATFQNRTWTLTQVDTGFAGYSSVKANEPVSGWLPGAARAANDAPVEFEAAFYMAPWNLAVFAVVAPTSWYGIGGGLVSGPDGNRLLRGELRYDHDKGFDPYLDGAFEFGDDRARISGSSEWPGTEDGRAVRAIERRTLFRNWTVSEAGLNLSGDAHALGIRGWRFDEASLETAYHAGFQYATGQQIRQHLTVDVDIEQATRVKGESRSHDAFGGVRLRFPFGDKGAWTFSPDLAAVMNFGVLPESSGFEASASGAVLAGVETGLRFAGRFQSWTHFLTPHLRLQTEAYGFEQRTTLPAGSIGFPFARVPQWTYGVFGVDQKFQFSSWTLGLPANVQVSSEGFETLFDQVTTSLGITASSGALTAEVAGLCKAPCDTLRYAVAIDVQANGYALFAASSDLSASDQVRRSAWARRTGVVTQWKLSNTAQEPSLAAHMAGGRIPIRRFHVGATGVLTPELDSATGGWFTAGYSPALLGWSLNLSGGATRDGAWNTSLAWSLTN